MTSARRADPFGARDRAPIPGADLHYYRLDRIAERAGVDLLRLPYSIRILLEAALRHCDGYEVSEDDVLRVARWSAASATPAEVPFKPGRVILQDFTGVPCVVDLAAMRDAMKRLGGDPARINPLVPVDLVIDHSVQVDVFGNTLALEKNAEIEFERNRERYEFLRWGQKAFRNFSVVPPATGIVHQVNLEYLARGVLTAPDAAGGTVVFPDSLVGTDSHTTMINGLGVLGWGVGGIEAEAVMLGQPLYLLMPQVVGFRLTGKLREGVTATDLVLTVTQMLRKKGVVDTFVEFYGPGISSMSLADRATIGNMSPEFGATIGFFPVDAETLRYLERTNRAADARKLEAYARAQMLFRTDDAPEPEFSDTLALDLGDVEPSLAGPKRPQDRVPLRAMQSEFRRALTAPVKERGYGLKDGDLARRAEVPLNGHAGTLEHGSVVIAAITSCTNTSNPAVMIAAGLVAQKAAARGLKVPGHVKTSMAPGSKVVTEYLNAAKLTTSLEALGFHTVGYGCTTCIAEGTPVLQANGTSRRIESMPELGGAAVFGPTPDGRLGRGLQTERMSQGMRECVQLVLQDGRTLTCTPDHRVLRADGSWVRADRLRVGEDRVVMGLEAPLDEPAADEVGWKVEVGSRRFTLADAAERLRTLAFARLLGHLLGDGSISVFGQGRILVGQAIDRETVLDDLERVTGTRPKGSQYDERKWTIVLPADFTADLLKLEGVSAGRRIDQPAELPAFVLDPSCPIAVVREFLGGVFGADGHAPGLHRNGAREDDATVGMPAYSRSTVGEHLASWRTVMDELLRLLGRCGVDTGGAQVHEYPTRRSASTYPAAQDGEPRIEVRLKLSDGLSFVERVGYRYAVDKTMRASAAAVYWRMASMSPIAQSRKSSTISSVATMDPIESVDQVMSDLGVEDWFSETSVAPDLETIPTFSLQVIDRRPAGEKPVFDIAVDDLHAFVAGTVCVHNCIGNSGPLPTPISDAITQQDLVAAAVLSGNRNFEGRVNPHTRANYLASPPLVVAYALAGTVDIDFEKEPLGEDRDGQPVFLRDLWPSHQEITAAIDQSVKPEQFATQYANVFDGNPRWNDIPVAGGDLYRWDPNSTYIHEPPFFQGLTADLTPVRDVKNARCLVRVGDSVTTDHISPAGDIAKGSPAGRWLEERGVEKKDFNSYGSRRGNDLVMVRGTFANIRLKNLLVPGSEGNVTVHFPSGEQTSIFDAAERYRAEGVPLVVLAGKEYGTGSSRDWAAKGVLLLGVRAVIAETYERIHRSNLVGMGVLPLQYAPGTTAETLGLTGRETFDVIGLEGELSPRMTVTVHARRDDGATVSFPVTARFDTPVEVEYYKNGGILQTVLRKLARG
jgi:aconitase A